MLKFPLPLTSAPSTDLCAAATTPCISHHCTSLCAILHWCNTSMLLTMLHLASLGLLHCSTLWCFIRICLYRHLPVLLLLFWALVATYNPRGWAPRGSCPSSPVVLLLSFLLLSCRCECCILFFLLLDFDPVFATPRLGHPSDLFLTKSRPQFLPIWKARPAQYALDKYLLILWDCIQCGPHHQFPIQRGPYGT